MQFICFELVGAWSTSYPELPNIFVLFPILLVFSINYFVFTCCTEAAECLRMIVGNEVTIPTSVSIFLEYVIHAHHANISLKGLWAVVNHSQ